MLSYTAPRATVQQLLQKHPQPVNENVHVQKVLQRIKTCRTSALGYHVYQCSDEECGHVKYQYHSCRDRHCPNCGAVKKQEWIEARRQELLPVKYYHVVFTLPHELNSVIMGHRRILFKLLFDASAQTLLTFAKDEKYLGAASGIISVLHTWGQQLSFHPHIHCIVSGGGITNHNAWKEAKKNTWLFLFPVKAISIVYRAKFLQGLQQLIANGEVVLPDNTDRKKLFDLLYQKDWVVYAKAPFGGPHAVIEYLGRYTHKVAISNHRIRSINDQEGLVTFDYKDYADEGKQKQMTLSGGEFIRRFEQHILPERFCKIRTYGYLANRNRHQRINEVLKKMKLPLHKGLVKIPLQIRMLEQFGIDTEECPCCKNKTLKLVKVFYPWKKGDDG
jgi:putative transposase/transposase-like zinc-binding protein